MFGTVPVCPVPVWISYRTCRSVRYRHGFRTELTEESGTGIDVVPNLPKCPVPVLMYRTYGSVRYRYESLYRYRRYRYSYRTEVTEVSSTGMHVVPNLPKCPVPVCISYRTYRSVRYRYMDVALKLPKCPIPVLILYRTYRSVRYRY